MVAVPAVPWDAAEALRLSATMRQADLARRYGLSPSAIHWRLVKAQVYGAGLPRPTTRRTCLGPCQSPFDSHGAHERVCPACKSRPEWRQGDLSHAAHSGQASHPRSP